MVFLLGYRERFDFPKRAPRTGRTLAAPARCIRCRPPSGAQDRGSATEPCKVSEIPFSERRRDRRGRQVIRERVTTSLLALNVTAPEARGCGCTLVVPIVRGSGHCCANRPLAPRPAGTGCRPLPLFFDAGTASFYECFWVTWHRDNCKM